MEVARPQLDSGAGARGHHNGGHPPPLTAAPSPPPAPGPCRGAAAEPLPPLARPPLLRRPRQSCAPGTTSACPAMLRSLAGRAVAPEPERLLPRPPAHPPGPRGGAGWSSRRPGSSCKARGGRAGRASPGWQVLECRAHPRRLDGEHTGPPAPPLSHLGVRTVGCLLALGAVLLPADVPAARAAGLFR